MCNPLHANGNFASHSEVILDFCGTDMLLIEINYENKRVVYTLYPLLFYAEWKIENKFILYIEFLLKRNSQLH